MVRYVSVTMMKTDRTWMNGAQSCLHTRRKLVIAIPPSLMKCQAKMENVRRPEKGYGLEAIVSSEECFSISVYDVNERQEKDEWVG
jgi:hypothetical protein